jgi:signal peptidase I
MSQWARLVAASLARVVLTLGLCLALWAAAPALLGWQPTTVMTGSMQPRINPGDVVIARPVPTSELRPGQVLLVDDPDHPDRLRLHRLVRSNPDGRLILRGDANPAADSTPVDPHAVHGVGVLRVPYVGTPILWLHNHAWTNLAILLALIATLIAATSLDHDLTHPVSGTDLSGPPPPPAGEPRPTPTGPGHEPTTRLPAEPTPQTPALTAHTVARPARLGLITASTIAAIALVTVMGLSPAGAAFAKTTANTANTWAAAPYFTCSAAVLAATPYLYYKLDENSATSGATATDSSGNNRNGTYHGSGTTTGSPGACARDAGTAITLNGSTGYLSAPTLISTAPNIFTIEAWFKTSTTKGGKLIGYGNAQTGASTSYDRHLYMTNTGQIVFGVRPGTVKTITSPASYNTGTWHLATATLSPAGMKLYMDGLVVATDTTTTTGQAFSGYWRIGYDNLASWTTPPTSFFLAATIDDVAVYTTALTPTQIADHYNAAQ